LIEHNNFEIKKQIQKNHKDRLAEFRLRGENSMKKIKANYLHARQSTPEDMI